MYENMENYFWGKDVIKTTHSLFSGELIIVEEIQPFCINSVNQLTENDLIVADPIQPEGTSFLKPIRIDFKNNCYAIIHKEIGVCYSGRSYFSRNSEFEGFTCLTIDGNFYEDMLNPDIYVNRFILKCKSNKHSQKINIDPTWLDFCKNHNIQ